MNTKKLFILPALSFLFCCCSITSVGYHGGVTIPKTQIIESTHADTSANDTSFVPVSGVFFETSRGKTNPLKLRFDLEFIWKHEMYSLSEQEKSFLGLYMNTLLKWKFSPYNSPYIITGLRGGVYSDLFSDSKNENRENVKILDYGLVVGSGIEFDLNVMTIFFEWRYHHGLGQMQTDELVNFRNRFHSFTIGMQIHDLLGGDD